MAPTSDAPVRPAGLNQSLARGLVILKEIADSGGELGVRELGRMLDIDKSIVSRLLITLAEYGFVERNPLTRRYGIGSIAFAIGQRNSQFSHLHTAAYDDLQRLSRREGLNVYLAIRSHAEVLYVCSIQSAQESVFRVNTGVRGHLHSTSLGKVLLAAMDDAALAAMLKRLPLSRLTPYTITSAKKLLAEIQEVRKRGYATADEENLAGIYSVGAPIRDASGKVIAAMSSASHKEDRSKAFLHKMIEITERTAGIISGRLGALPAAPFAYLDLHREVPGSGAHAGSMAEG